MMKVIVPTSDKYQFIMPVFCQLFNKYWPNQECIILCYSQIKDKLPDNFEIISLGPDNKDWTAGLRPFFSSFKDEYFVLHLEDHILTDYVKINKLKIMENEIISGADKAMLHSHLNIFSQPLHDDILLINQDIDYRTTIHTAIWRTSYFLKYLQYNCSNVFAFELIKDARNDGAKIVSLKSINSYQDHIIDFMNLFRNKQVDTSMTGLWHEEDLEILLQIPLSEVNRQILIRKTNNYCPICNKKVDRFLIIQRHEMKQYEIYGTCIYCQKEREQKI
ncbi:MAG: hypothetical protein Q7R95_01415 [bacterium]|nr:hypothetical protein [bacterium]